MDLQKEREAFISTYMNYKDDSRKIQFNEETKQFMWRKNNVSDTEVEYIHLMNQRWYAWLACAKSKAQAESALLEQFEINNKLVEQIEKLKADVPGQITVTHERLQELITIAVKAALDEREQSHD